jgi:hypothetical protein
MKVYLVNETNYNYSPEPILENVAMFSTKEKANAYVSKYYVCGDDGVWHSPYDRCVESSIEEWNVN